MFERGFGANGIDGLRVPTTPEAVDNLNKALAATGDYVNAPGTLTQGAAFQVESLDYTMKVVTMEEQHLKLWAMIPKSRARNVIEEINILSSHGKITQGMNFFDAEARVLPNENDPEVARDLIRIRYIGDTRIVTHPATLVQTSGDSMMAIQAREGTLNVLSSLERAMFVANSFMLDPATGAQSGDSANVASRSLQFSGFEKQIRNGDTNAIYQYKGFEGYDGALSSVKDLQGATPTPDTLEDLGRIALENWSVPTHLMLSPAVHSTISRQYMLKERVNPLGVANGVGGYVLTDFFSSGGVYKLLSSPFLRARTTPLSVADASAPAMPVVSGSGTEADTSSLLATATYSFRVSACNNYGESLACAHFEQAVAAGNRITITVAAGTTGALWYAVFQAPAGTTANHKFVGFCKDSLAAGGGGVTIRIAGKRVPGLGCGYLLSITERTMTARMLAPLMKMDLGIIDPSFRFMVLLYTAPWLFTPKSNVLLDNPGSAV